MIFAALTLSQMGIIPNFTANITSVLGLSLTQSFTATIANGLGNVFGALNDNNTCNTSDECNCCALARTDGSYSCCGGNYSTHHTFLNNLVNFKSYLQIR